MTKGIARHKAADAAERDRLKEIARGNVERNAAWEEDASADTIYDEVYTLAFDALHDHGCVPDVCRDIATEIAMEHAQP